MKILRTKQIIEIKNVRHLKFVRYILTLCFLLFIVVGITGCTKEYTADDIKSYAKETLSIRRVTVYIIPHEYKDEDGYTDILWLTIVFEPIIAPLPIVQPFMIFASRAIHTCAPIITFLG